MHTCSCRTEHCTEFCTLPCTADHELKTTASTHKLAGRSSTAYNTPTAADVPRYPVKDSMHCMLQLVNPKGGAAISKP